VEWYRSGWEHQASNLKTNLDALPELSPLHIFAMEYYALLSPSADTGGRAWITLWHLRSLHQCHRSPSAYGTVSFPSMAGGEHGM